jgi:hypothetical protein
MMFWDVIDNLRKMLLNGFITRLVVNEGSNKLLFRLIVASTVSGLYLAVLAFSRPYTRKGDFQLAVIASLLLLCSFTAGVILHLCKEKDDDDQDDYQGTCEQFIGFKLNSFRASIFVVVLPLGMIVTAINEIKTPTVRLVSTSDVPNLEIPRDCSYHMFLSHVWSTGKSNTHVIARKLQLLLPKLSLWLDVDSLVHIDNLEESVAECAVFTIYYSKGYFRSQNCRRELYTSVELEKPTIVLYEIVLYEVHETRVLETLGNECIAYCKEEPGPERILEHLMKNDPIQWLHDGSFSAAAIKRTFTCLLSHLPYYQDSKILDQGLSVPGEIGPVSLPSAINVLVCDVNIGALEVAKEIQEMMSSSLEN